MLRVLTLFTGLVLVSACQEPPAPQQKVIRPIAWMQVQAEEMQQMRRLSGILAPVETARLSFEVPGKIASVSATLGEKVSKGQELARLDQRTFHLSVQSAEGQLDKANAALVEARNTYKRYTELLASGGISQSGYDNARAAFESAQSASKVAQTQLDIARKNLQDSILSAPYDGVITQRLIEPSQQIAAGQPGFEIEGEDGLEVHVLVPENLIQLLRRDQALDVHFPVAPDMVLQGQITELGTRAQNANTFPVTVLLNDTHPNLRAGMTAEVDFLVDAVGRTGFSGPGIRIPVSAISPDMGQGAFVFVYDEASGTVRKRTVQTEAIFNNTVYLSSGLNNGEIIAVAGVAHMHDGQQVTLQDNMVQVFN